MELGALLYLLSLDTGHFLRLGGGKPLGFGSVGITLAQLDLADGQAIRKDLLSIQPVIRGDDAGRLSAPSPEASRTVAEGPIKAFKKAMKDACGVAAKRDAARGYRGRLRRWLPRQIDIDKVSDEEIQDIVITANLTPRKCLGFKTPLQAILKELGKDVQIRFA
jgi:hypothetical protein